VAADELDDFLVHTVTITPKVGDGAYGAQFGAPVPDVPAWVDDTRRLVRDADGAEVVSSSTVFLRTGTDCPPGSLIALPSGRSAEVIAVAVRDSGPLDLPDHVEVSVA
jgi:hypothetical protein